MSTPNGQQEPYSPNPDQRGEQPSQASGAQGTSAPEEDIPRQQASREDQQAAPGPGQHVPRQGAGWEGGQQGTYNAYPPASGYFSGSAGPPSYLQGGPANFGEAVVGAMSNIFTYRGRASRSAFWWFALLEVIASWSSAGYPMCPRPRASSSTSSLGSLWSSPASPWRSGGCMTLIGPAGGGGSASCRSWAESSSWSSTSCRERRDPTATTSLVNCPREHAPLPGPVVRDAEPGAPAAAHLAGSSRSRPGSN